jgi:hypothetical protein
MTNYPQSLRIALTKKKGWWEQTFSFYRIMAFLRILENIIREINTEMNKHKTQKNTIRNFLFRSGKVCYALAVSNGGKKNYKLEKMFFSFYKMFFETRFFLYGF